MNRKVMIILALNLIIAATGMVHPAQYSGPKKVVDISMTDVFLDGCRVWVRFANTGSVKIDKIMRETVWVDNVIKDSNLTHVVLKPGQVSAHGVLLDPGLVIIGTHLVKAQIDVANILPELNEANNIKAVSLTCKLHVPPDSLQAATSDVTVAFDSKNMTRKDSGNQFVYSCDILFTMTNSGPGGTFKQCGPDISFDGAAAGQVLTKQTGPYQYVGPPPTYRATVDYKNQVADHDETNNQATKKFPD